jgi:hypothetical protein
MPLPVETSPAATTVSVVLAEAREADRDLPPAIRGWRSPTALAEAISRHTGWQPDVSSIRAYLSRLHRLLREAVQQAKDVSPESVFPQSLIERRRGMGARLSADLRIVHLGEDLGRQPRD